MLLFSSSKVSTPPVADDDAVFSSIGLVSENFTCSVRKTPSCKEKHFIFNTKQISPRKHQCTWIYHIITLTLSQTILRECKQSQSILCLIWELNLGFLHSGRSSHH